MKKRALCLVLVFAFLFGLVPQLYSDVNAVESYLWPVDGYYTMYRGYSTEINHKGIDIDAPLGTTIRASKSGTVEYVNNSCPHTNYGSGCSCGGGAGNYIMVRNDDGSYCRYLHMQQNSPVPLNTRLNQGDYVGKVGSSGDSTGPHLHFEIMSGGNYLTDRINCNPTDSRHTYHYGAYTPAVSYIYELGSSPVVCFDWVKSPEPGKIHIHGWAFDADDMSGTVTLHVYSGTTFLGEVRANTSRPDVDNVYHCGANHGFDAVLNISLSGTINVNVAALNTMGGGNTTWGAEKSVTVAADTEQPKISDVQISDRSSTGFTLTCKVTDNVGIKEVKFPTWSDLDGQDDLVWHTGTLNGNIATCRINVSDHKNNVDCIYITDIYAYDYAGNTTMFRTSFGVDATPPIISTVAVENITDEGYDIFCTVTDDDQAGVAKVSFPTWTSYNDQDDLIHPWEESPLYAGTIDGDKVRYHVSFSDHNNEKGYYHTHIYAYDASGNSDWFAVDAYIGEISERSEHILQTGTFRGNQYIVFSNESYWSAASTYCQSLGGHLVSINSKEENDFVRSLLSTDHFAYWIGANDIAGEGTFVWDTGEAFNYSNWRAGEPNNDGGQDCGLITITGEWDDEKVNATYPFVMEIESAHTEHVCELQNAVSATCTKAGYTGDEVCTICGETVQKGSVIPAKGHSWDAGQVTKQPTGSAEGVMTYTCTRCGDKRTESIPKLTNPFKDVIKGKFYYDAVLWAVNQDPQITSGYADGTFRPDQTCTRAQVVTFLWRAEGCPEPTTTKNPFKDVSTSAYYYKAVLWAVENNITTGYADGTFRPGGECTRAHVVTFLWRMEGSPAPTSTTSSFKDVPAGQFYTNAALWAVENGITTGYSDGTFRPDSPCTRGHVVTFLYRDMA